MKVNGSADFGQIQGMIVKVKPVRDGTLMFEVTCHDSRGRVAYRVKFYLPPKSVLRDEIKGGRRARILFETTGRPRETPASIEFLSD